MKLYSIPIKNFSSIEEDADSQFFKVTLMVIAEGENLNGSCFTLKGMQECKDTFLNKPILCSFKNGQMGDEHNFDFDIDPATMEPYTTYLKKGAERPVGLIPESSNIRIENIEGKNWIVLDGYIWEKYNYELVRDIKMKASSGGWSVRNNKRISAEICIDEESVDFEDGGEVEVLNKWVGCGVTILGDSVQEAVPGANLRATNIDSTDLKKYTENFMNRFFAERNNKGAFASKVKNGSGKALKVNKSKEAMSEDSWGKINKSTLRNKIMEASNYKTLVKDVYMIVEDGYEDSPSESLKYPVMQLKGDTLVYNKNALSSALAYAVAENETAVVKIVKSIQKKLGVLSEEDKTKNKKGNKNMDLSKKINETSKRFIAIRNLGKDKYVVFDKDKEEFATLPFIEKENEVAPVMEEKQDTKVMARPLFEDCPEGECPEGEVPEEDIEESLSKVLAKCSKDSEAKEKELAKCKEELAAKEEELAKKCEELSDKEKILAEKQTVFANKDKECMAKEEELAKCKEELAAKEKEFSDTEQERMAQDLKSFAEEENLSEDEVKEYAEKKEEFKTAKEFMKEVTYSHFARTRGSGKRPMTYSYNFNKGNGSETNVISRLAKNLNK